MTQLAEYWGTGTDDPFASDPSAPPPIAAPGDQVYVPPDLPTAPPATPASTGPLPLPSAASPAALPGSGLAPRTRSGLTIIALGVSAAAGAWLGGAWGAGAGVILTGATRNVWRARQIKSADAAVRAEAIKAGTVGLLGLGIGGWLAYKAYQTRTG